MNTASMSYLRFRLTFLVLSSFICSGYAEAEPLPDGLEGDWTLQMESGLPAWMRVLEKEGKPIVSMRVYIGPAGPYEDVVVNEGRLSFELKKRKKVSGLTQLVEVGLVDGVLDGIIHRHFSDGGKESESFTGKRIPPMTQEAPDLSQVKFGEPVSLFNGKDLTGWIPHETDKIMGWSAKDGLLVNATPKTDFSATGDHANLKTEAVFDDFRLQLEFLIGSDRNSGIYLKGTYEAQVVDRDSRMQGLQGVGAIFGLIPPSENAGRVGGEWQSYDITLVDRHITVVLNGVKVIDNQPVEMPTAGAINTDPFASGPIYLQGDHTSVAYRNIIIEPVLKE
ncbi:MAG: DUF1080 domain-containing protein [Verrucomicrobiales bacterium]|nr:DUF1080 domain-containing protein [Verrucomicrobiales bacterium]